MDLVDYGLCGSPRIANLRGPINIQRLYCNAPVGINRDSVDHLRDILRSRIT